MKRMMISKNPKYFLKLSEQQYSNSQKDIFTSGDDVNLIR
jgi:hypothetical protein